MSDCSICNDTFTVRLRKPISCPHCGFVCCLNCLRRFILSSATEPACMSCKVQFSYDFVIEHLPSTFWNNDYKEFRKNLLLSREEALLPDTQDTVEKIRCRDNLHKYMCKFQKKITSLQRTYRQIYRLWTNMNDVIVRDINGTEAIAGDHPLFRDFDEACNPLVDEDDMLVALRQNPSTTGDRVRRDREVAQSTFIHACPGEGCRGFLRGDQSRCSVCQTRVCPRCIAVIHDDTDTQHECKPGDIQTVELLRQNTKPCPQCSMSIYKVSGCDQMWCTQCRTPFSWRTGQKINQTIHNPHYYEWLQQGGRRDAGRELMDIPCGGLPEIYQLDAIFKGTHRRWAYSVHRQIVHVEHVLVPRSQRIADEENNLKRMRVDYLLNSLTRDEWRDELYKQEKVRQKHQQYLQILQTFVAVLSDWMRRVVLTPPEDIEKEIDTTINFLFYLDQQASRLNSRYKSSLSSPCVGLIPFHKRSQLTTTTSATTTTTSA